MRVELLRMTIDEGVALIMEEAGFPNPHQRRFKRTRDALEISLTDLARSPRNKTGHLHLARVKGRRIVLQKTHWDAVAASVLLLRSLREAQMPPLAVRENSLMAVIARTCRTIDALDEHQLSLLTAVMCIEGRQLCMKSEAPGASVEEIASFLSAKGMYAPPNLESSLDDLTPGILHRSSRHLGHWRCTAAS